MLKSKYPAPSGRGSLRSTAERQNPKFYNKGAAAILLTLLISGLILIIVLGVSSIIIAEIKLSRNIEESAVAFYAADAGTEKCLFEVNTISGPCGTVGESFKDSLSNGATFETTRKSNNSLSSIGEFKNINRKVELNW